MYGWLRSVGCVHPRVFVCFVNKRRETVTITATIVSTENATAKQLE